MDGVDGEPSDESRGVYFGSGAVVHMRWCAIKSSVADSLRYGVNSCLERKMGVGKGFSCGF